MPSPNPHHSPLTGQAGFDRSPFLRLTELIAGITPSKPVINLSVGEPQHGVPDLIKDAIASHIAEFGKYPPIKGIEAYRIAAARWMNQRFALPRALDPESEILALNGSREGLFMAAQYSVMEPPDGAAVFGSRNMTTIATSATMEVRRMRDVRFIVSSQTVSAPTLVASSVHFLRLLPRVGPRSLLRREPRSSLSTATSRSPDSVL